MPGANTISGATSDTRTFAHTGSEIGDENVELYSGTGGSERYDPVLSWQIPRKYRAVSYAAGRHFTKARLRHREDIDGQSGTEVVLEDSYLMPIGGKEDVDDQPFDVAVVYDLDAEEELHIEEVDYSANNLHLEEDPNGNDLAVYPIITTGTVQYRAENAFGHTIGPLDEWGVPVHVFADFKQNKNDTKIHLVGAAEFSRDETLTLYYDGPNEIVWEDDDYPRGKFASMWQQKLDVEI